MPSNNTVWYCLSIFYIFLFIKNKRENWYDFFLIRTFIISPLLINILFLNQKMTWGFACFWFAHVFFYAIYYFFMHFKKNIFFLPCATIFLFTITYINITTYQSGVQTFNSKESYFLLIILYLVHFFSILFLLIFVSKNQLNKFK